MLLPTAIKIGERTVTWEFTFNHAAQVRVYQAGDPATLFCDINSNGSLLGQTQLGDFSIGALNKIGGTVPGGTVFPMKYEMTVPGSYTPIECHCSFGIGTHMNETVGTLTITAVCDIMYDLIDDGVHGWAIDSDTLVESGPLYDTPNLNHAKLYLQLTEDATYSMATNTNTYTGTIGLTSGVELQNRLWASGTVTSTSTSYEANGSIDVVHSCGNYSVDTNVSRSWTDGGTSTATAEMSTGHVESSALSGDMFEMVSAMTGTWNVERTAHLGVGLYDQGGTGINADITVLRYGDDPLPETKATVSGAYSEDISQIVCSWDWTATHNGNSAPAPLSGSYTGWGDLGVALDATWNASEQQALPDDWAENTSSPYLVHRDGTIPIHTFHDDSVVAIAQSPTYTLRAGYNDGQYTLSSNTLLSDGDASTGSQVGVWSVSTGAAIELDNINDRILIKPATNTPCVAKRTLLLDTAQCGSSPTKPARDAWAGYRWLTITLEPADTTTGEELVSVGDIITVEIDQDNLEAAYPIPSEQTWTGPANVTKRYSTVTQRTGNDTFITIDLASPLTPTASYAGENPPVTGNYGDDTTAHHNVLSRYPKPTMDAPNGGITNANEVRLTLPGDAWWRIGEFTLHHKTGASPVYELMPAYNQWIRLERKDKIDEDDTVEAKTWGRRLFVSRCEGLIGAELFDIQRDTSYSVENGYHSFTFAPHDLYTTLEQLTSLDTIHNIDTLANIGAIRPYPGWSYTVTLPDSDTYPIKYDIDYSLTKYGCYLGGRGIIWNDTNAVVSSELSLSSVAPTLQGLTQKLDWFADCGDVFEVADSSTTGAIYAKGATVLRGKVEGLGKYGNSYDLTEDTRPTITTSTIVNNTAAGVYGDLVMCGGHQKLDHHVLKDGATTGVEFNHSSTILWTVVTASDPTLVTATVTECPSWCEQRGIYVVQYSQGGVLRPRFRASDGKPLCQKRGLGRTLEGRCVRCPHGA